MFSRTSEYALRAMVFLAQHADTWPIPGWRIAEQTGIPPKYLARILGDLVRHAVLESSRGIGGGFRLARSPDRIRLSEVLAPFEPALASRRPCPFGHELCNDKNPCPGHDRWMRVKNTYERFLQETSVSDISGQQDSRRGSPRKKRKK